MKYIVVALTLFALCGLAHAQKKPAELSSDCYIVEQAYELIYHTDKGSDLFDKHDVDFVSRMSRHALECQKSIEAPVQFQYDKLSKDDLIQDIHAIVVGCKSFSSDRRAGRESRLQTHTDVRPKGLAVARL
jgi:hypothetical protein